MINSLFSPVFTGANALTRPLASAPSIASAPSYSMPMSFNPGMSQMAYNQMQMAMQNNNGSRMQNIAQNIPTLNQIQSNANPSTGMSNPFGVPVNPIPPTLPATPPRPSQAVLTGMPQVPRPPVWSAPMASDYQNSLISAGPSQQRQFHYF